MSPILFICFNLAVAASLLIRYRAVIKADSYPELLQMLEGNPKTRKMIEMPLARSYWVPAVLGVISLFSVINSIPDEIVESDQGATPYLLELITLLVLIATWAFLVYKLRKVQRAISAPLKFVPEPVYESVAPSVGAIDAGPRVVGVAGVETVTPKKPGLERKIKLAGAVVASLGLLLIIFSLLSGRKSGADAQRDEAIRAQLSDALTAPVTLPAAAVAPQPEPATANVASASQGTFDANATDAPTEFETSGGKLAMATLAGGTTTVVLNGNPIFTGPNSAFLHLVKQFKLAGNRDVVLLTSTGGMGNSCESMFVFITFESGRLKNSPQFGTCAPAGTVAQSDTSVSLTLPKMGGNTLYAFDGSELKEDGKVVTLTLGNDPSL